MDNEELWRKALEEHNSGDFHEAHEIFEDLWLELDDRQEKDCLLYTSPSPRDGLLSRMPSSA